MTLQHFNDRKLAKVALVSEFGGDDAPLRLAAMEAINRGLYSPKTILGDIESALKRAWRAWKRARLAEERASSPKLERDPSDSLAAALERARRWDPDAATDSVSQDPRQLSAASLSVALSSTPEERS